jgi:predicted transcriptional regulator of viral defense system
LHTKPWHIRYDFAMSVVLSRLLEVAVDQHGLFTLDQAASTGVSDDQVRRSAGTGVLERRAHGVYRIVAIPFNQYTELMEAVLWAKGRALIAGESALALWDLADVNPRKVHLAIAPRYRPRRAGGDRYEMHHVAIDDAERDEAHGVPVVAPAIAIEQSIDWGIAGDMIEQAIRRGRARELIGEQTVLRLLAHLEHRTSGSGARSTR